MYKNLFKRILDISLSLLGLIFTIPIFIIIYILLLLLNLDDPIFYQARPGKGNKIFKLLKFKTMKDIQDSNGRLFPDCDRLTKIGKFIRRTSLDELPQLINVIKGDMSLIGPRPLLVEYLPLYNRTQIRRHEIRPGITGWAQVNGRNELKWEDKFKFDVWYVDNISLKLDLIIIVLTLRNIFMQEGINSKSSTTAERFEGNSQIDYS